MVLLIPSGIMIYRLWKQAKARSVAEDKVKQQMEMREKEQNAMANLGGYSRQINQLSSNYEETNVTYSDMSTHSSGSKMVQRNKIVPKIVHETYIDPELLKGTW
ncbi:hypothetical protein FGO68_gene4735 [Halteria grandinella]|uniref:Uncharacterized protein n=1 Tax=Halteria grandinella TaxID=5974 RepID=A0A8J8T1R5_HALGN|nr:hypothetical protein FGO68_gene4735 [Halteria grandinella]